MSVLVYVCVREREGEGQRDFNEGADSVGNSKPHRGCGVSHVQAAEVRIRPQWLRSAHQTKFAIWCTSGVSARLGEGLDRAGRPAGQGSNESGVAVERIQHK